MLKVVAAVVSVYALGLLGVSLVVAAGSSEDAKRAAFIRELGAAYDVTPLLDQPMLRADCEGKLEPRGPTAVVAYVRPMKDRPMLDQAIDDVLVGTTDVFHLQIDMRRLDGAPQPLTVGQALLRNLNPIDWPRHWKAASRGTPDLSDATWVVIANYGSLRLPVSGADSYAVGSGSFSAEVIRLSDGAKICEGRGDLHMRSSVAASGSDKAEARENARKLLPFVFARSVMVSPLHDVCAAGGEALCHATEAWTR